MDSKIFSFADKTFKITPTFEAFFKFAKNYIVDVDSYDYEISTSLEEIKKWDLEHKDENEYPLAYIETLVIHSKIADILADESSFIFHGSCIYVDDLDNAYIFTAPSGTGKSTHTELLRKYYPNKINYVNGDKPFIRYINNEYIVYGSPWDGKERNSNNVKAKLKGIFIVNRSKENKVNKLEAKQAINHLIKQIHIPSKEDAVIKGIDFITKLCKDLPIYLLDCDISKTAASTSYEIMNK